MKHWTPEKTLAVALLGPFAASTLYILPCLWLDIHPTNWVNVTILLAVLAAGASVLGRLPTDFVIRIVLIVVYLLFMPYVLVVYSLSLAMIVTGVAL